MVINKQTGSTPVSVNLANFIATSSAQAWQINAATQTSITRLTDVPVANNTLSTIVPSQSITLFILPSATPVITVQPISQTATAGTAVTFSVTALGNPSPTYQWSKNGSPVNGATQASLVLSKVSSDDAGSYAVAVSNASVTVVSNAATLTVNLLSQIISFAPIADLPFATSPLVLTASVDSGLPISFSLVSGPATLAGNLITLTGVGPITVQAAQAGNTMFLPAIPVTRSFTATADFASWQQSVFTPTELANTAISGSNAVYSRDGLPNLVKYALGLDPHQTITSGLPAVTASAGNWLYTWKQPSQIGDVTGNAEVSTDLINWTKSGITQSRQSSTSGIDTWVAAYPEMAATPVFFHLKFTLSPGSP
jgi:hypothetical protein